MTTVRLPPSGARDGGTTTDARPAGTGRAHQAGRTPVVDRDPATAMTLADSVPPRYQHLGRVLDLKELAELPPPMPLIEGLIDQRQAVVVVGDTGTNKTFAMVALACAVASGEPWLGHAVCIEPSPVIFVAGEGGSGLSRRFRAWRKHHNRRFPSSRVTLAILPADISQSHGFWVELGDLALRIGARLVVLDTLSSLAPAASETEYPALLLRAMSDLAAAADCTVVVCHHTGWKEKGRARGGSQIHANADCVLVLQKTSTVGANTPVSLEVAKSKEREAGNIVYFQRANVDLGAGVQSCVLEVIDSPARLARPDRKAAVQEALLAEVAAHPWTHSKTSLATAVTGTHSSKLGTIESLIASGQIAAEPRTSENASGTSRTTTRLGPATTDAA